MNNRTIIAVATGVIAGATVVGVPALAYADPVSGADTASSDGPMESVMDDPAFYDRMMAAMSELMSDPEMQERMRDHMSSMMEGMDGHMENMPSMEGMDGRMENMPSMDGMGGAMSGGSSEGAGDAATP